MPNDPEPHVRKLSLNDVTAAFELSTEAGWNQTEQDWRVLIELAPEGCFAVEVDGEIAATATLLAYEQRLAWIGMVLTRNRFRGRGFAKRLMTEAIGLADHLVIGSVKLDATDQGKPLYEKLGFRSEQAVERWGCDRIGIAPSGFVLRRDFTPELFSMDLAAFGAHRSLLLRMLNRSSGAHVLDNSYALTRAGRVSQYLGPCVADSPSAARTLISSSLGSMFGQSCYWDLFPSNKHAVELARELGFAPKRHLTRMGRGRDLRGDDQRVYALAGFELG